MHACRDWALGSCAVRNPVANSYITRESPPSRDTRERTRRKRAPRLGLGGASPLGTERGKGIVILYVSRRGLPITVVRTVVLVASTTPPPRTGQPRDGRAGHAAPPARARRARPLPLSSPRSRPVARLRPGRGTVSRGRRPGVESVERPWSLVAAWSPPPREAATSVPTPCRDGRATFSLSSTPQRGRPHTQQSRNGNHETAIRMPMHT